MQSRWNAGENFMDVPENTGLDTVFDLALGKMGDWSNYRDMKGI